MLTLAGCAAGGASGAGTSTAFGGALNHTHDILVLRGVGTPQSPTVLLATHIGLYRSADGGSTWSEVAGGAGQPMNGLMIYKLAQSPVDPQRVYVLAIVRTAGAAPSPPGVYTSADAGRSWRLAAPLTDFANSAIFTISAGANGPGQVYVIDSTLGAHGLFMSMDAGAHWQAAPALPTSDPSGILDDPQHPAHVLLWSRSTGLYESADMGQTWMAAPGSSGAVYAATIAGATIYAPGDQGLFVSTDDGASFRLVDQLDTFTTVIAGAASPERAYALGGTTVYTTTDGGQSWRPTATTSQHPGALTVDPANPAIAFVAFSYPVGVAMTTTGGARWRDVAP
jgi:photosystem II stability/assembly factor-like uncharacterized protein